MISRRAATVRGTPPCTNLDLRRAPPLEHDARHQRIADDGEILPLSGVAQERGRGGFAPAVADRHLPAAKAFLLCDR